MALGLRVKLLRDVSGIRILPLRCAQIHSGSDASAVRIGEIKIREDTNMNKLLQALVVMIVMGALNLFAQEQALSQPYEEGEFWHFSVKASGFEEYKSTRLVTGTYEIAHSQNQLKAFYLGPNGKEDTDLSSASLIMLLGRGKDFSFPLAVGKKWSYRYPRLIRTLVQQGVIFRWRNVDINVAGSERIDTEAGVYETFKLVKENRPMTGTEPWVTTYNYSPQTRSVVKLTSDEEEGSLAITLIKHGVVSAAPNILLTTPSREPVANTTE